MGKTYNKLVRDNIPEIIKNNGEEAIIRILNDDEYKIELERKLNEELKEVLEAENDDRIEELADMLEVMISLAELEKKTLEDIIEICDKKREKRGGFSKRLYLEKVIEK